MTQCLAQDDSSSILGFSGLRSIHGYGSWKRRTHVGFLL